MLRHFEGRNLVRIVYDLKVIRERNHWFELPIYPDKDNSINFSLQGAIWGPAMECTPGLILLISFFLLLFQPLRTQPGIKRYDLL